MRRILYIIFLLSAYYTSFGQCTADFEVEVEDNNYQFTNVSSYGADDAPLRNLWIFGDGSTSQEENPLHQYSTQGIYNVSLQIESATGCIDTVETLIEVCDLSLDFNLSTVCNDDNKVVLNLTVTDAFSILDSVSIFLDGNPISNVPSPIDGQLNLNIDVVGDGNQHFVRVDSEPNGFCSETISFFVLDCNASCFMSNLQIDEGAQETHTIVLQEEGFFPKNRVTNLGDKIQFIWLSDQHSTTSVDSISSDQWDSGVQDSSYIYEIFLKNPDIKPYYSSSDGGPNGTYTGNIIANCPTNLGSLLELTFTNNIVPESGFYIGIDGVTIKDTIYEYSPIGFTAVEFLLAGDGKVHQISVVDVEDPSCTLIQNVKAINCSGSFDCSLNVNAEIIDRCNQDSLVTLGIAVNSLRPTDEGVLIMLDDTLVMDTIFFDNQMANTSITLFGDGLIHIIKAVDLSDTLCTDEIAIKINDCAADCSIDNLEIGTGSNNTFVVAITESKVSVQDIVISSGDDILWQWLQDSIIGLRSVSTAGQDSWDSGILADGDIFISPILTAGLHPYYLYNENGDTIYNASIEVIASCENNQIPVVYNFFDVNGSTLGYDIYVDDIRLESGPFDYALDGNNKGIFQLEGDDQSHLIEVRDVSQSGCSAGSTFIAPSCEIPPCGGEIRLLTQDSCLNDNTINFLATVSHPDPDPNGFLFSLNGEFWDGFPFLYGENGQTDFDGSLLADSSVYIFTYQDIADINCNDTLIFQSPLCVTDCSLQHLSTTLIDSNYLELFPNTPDSLVGCRDSFVYVAVDFFEIYSDADNYFITVDSVASNIVYTYAPGDGINKAIIKILGDDNTHTIELFDGADPECRFTTEVYTPRCFSPCNLEISEIVSDSCISEVGYYTLLLDSTTNQYNYQVFYDENPIAVLSDSLLIQLHSTADGLPHSILIVDNEEPLCRDSIEFTASYCLECPIQASLIQRDSCEIGDSIGYSIVFDQGIDSLLVNVSTSDSLYQITPALIEYSYDIRLRGDSAYYEYIFTSTEDQFCADTIEIQTIDCTPIICDPEFTYTVDGLTYTFIDSSTTSEPITSQSWSINSIIEVGNLSMFNFTFDSIGVYNICHEITTDSCTSELCKDITIGDPCTLITPFYTIEPISDGFQFTNMSTGMIDEYVYNFGDGIFSNSENPFHIYAESGMYEACLIVRQEEFNCQLQYCETIDVLLSNNNPALNNYLNIYPNPLSNGQNVLNITYSGVQNLSPQDIKVISITGQKINIEAQEVLNNNTYKLTLPRSIPSGIYYLLIQSQQGLANKKFLITD